MWTLLGTLGAAGLGGLLGGKSKTQTQTGSQTSSTTPIENPDYQELIQKIIGMGLDKAGGGTGDYLKGYEAQGMDQINRTHDAIAGNLENMLTGRGLSTSPIAGQVDIQRELARGSDIGNFQANLPLVGRQLEQQDFGNIMAILGQRPIGSQTSGTTQGSITTPGNMAGGAFGDIGSMLGWLLGKGKLGGGSSSGGPFSV